MCVLVHASDDQDMADVKALKGNCCLRFCNTTTYIYLTATISALVLLNVFSLSSHLNTIRDLGRKMNHAMDQLYNLKRTAYAREKTSGNIEETNMKKTKTNIVTTTNEIAMNQASIYTMEASKAINQTSIYTTEARKAITTKTYPKERPLNCTACFQHNFTYVLNNKNMCTPTERSSSIEVIVLISSVHSNFEKRNALRETWLTPTDQNKSKFRYSFLLGMNSNKKLQVALETESATYNDIVQEDFIDTYHNLTLKTIMGVKWASIFCPNAKFVMKTDDDMFVNLQGLQKVLLKHGKKLQYSIGGQCRTNEGPIRSKGYKWYVPKALYPQSKYPGFCSGTGYVTSMSVAKQIYEVSQHVPFFYLEDVYIGLCVNRLGMGVTSLPGFHQFQVPIGCNYKNGVVITSHHLDPKLLRDVWSLKCNATIF